MTTSINSDRGQTSETLVTVGGEAPDFSLLSTPDQRLGLAELRGAPLVVTFYPADFSPVCGDQMALYNQILPAAILRRAEALHLDIDRFTRDLQSHTYAERIDEDLQSGSYSGVNGTPTFFINGYRHDGPFDIDSLLAAVGKVTAVGEQASL